jgi:hypothetical protein
LTFLLFKLKMRKRKMQAAAGACCWRVFWCQLSSFPWRVVVGVGGNANVQEEEEEEEEEEFTFGLLRTGQLLRYRCIKCRHPGRTSQGST